MSTHSLRCNNVPSTIVTSDDVGPAHGEGAPTPTALRLTGLRRLQSDLEPFLDTVDAISSQTDDLVLTEAAARVHESLSSLLAEIAVMLYRAKRRSRT